MREGIDFENMNTRLEIASRVLSGMLADPRVLGYHNTLPDLALKYADALIASEEATRKAESTITADDSRLAAEIRTFIRELEQNKAVGVAVSYVAQELRIMLERNNARRQS